MWQVGRARCGSCLGHGQGCEQRDSVARALLGLRPLSADRAGWPWPREGPRPGWEPWHPLPPARARAGAVHGRAAGRGQGGGPAASAAGRTETRRPPETPGDPWRPPETRRPARGPETSQAGGPWREAWHGAGDLAAGCRVAVLGSAPAGGGPRERGDHGLLLYWESFLKLESRAKAMSLFFRGEIPLSMAMFSF